MYNICIYIYILYFVYHIYSIMYSVQCIECDRSIVTRAPPYTLLYLTHKLIKKKDKGYQQQNNSTDYLVN